MGANYVVLGGSFDPMHIGHGKMLLSLLQNKNFSKVIAMPTAKSPHKDFHGAAYFDRLHFLKIFKRLLSKELGDKFIISIAEARLPQPNYTYRSVEYLKKFLRDDDKLFWAVGYDMYLDLPNWKNPKLLSQLCSFYVFRRKTYAVGSGVPTKEKKEILDSPYNFQVEFDDNPLWEISSTQLRAMIRQSYLTFENSISVDEKANYLLAEFLRQLPQFSDQLLQPLEESPPPTPLTKRENKWNDFFLQTLRYIYTKNLYR